MKYHLGVFTHGWIDLILEGWKTIESRFTKTRCAPFGLVQEGDVLYLKESGGHILGMATVAKVETFEDLTPEKKQALFKEHHRAIFYNIWIQSIDEMPEKWKTAKHATLIHLKDVVRFKTPVAFKKNDRRAWVVLDAPLEVDDAQHT